MGDFTWHRHENTDETFIVLDGDMTIEFHGDKIELSAGEMYVVPKGMEHKPSSKNECSILLIEPRGVINTGEIINELTVEHNIWI